MNKAVLVKKKWLTLIAAAAMGMTSQDALALKLEQALVVQLPDRTELHLRFDQDIPDSVLTFRTGEPQVQIIDFPLELANDKIDLTGQVAALPGGLRLQTKDRHTKIEFSVPENQEVQRIVSGKGMIFRIGGKPLVSGVKLASAKNAVLAKPIPEPKAEAKPEIILAKAGSAPVVAAATEKALTPAVDFSLQSLNVEENNDYTALVLQFNQGPNQNAIKSYSLMHAKQYVLDFPSLIDASQTLKLSGESRIENYNLFKTDTRSRMVLNLKDNYQVDPVFGETELRLMVRGPKPYEANSKTMLQDAATSPIMKVAMKEEMAQTEALKQAKPYTGPALMNASVAEKGEQGEVITLTFTQSDFETISEQKDSKLRVRIRGGKLGELGQEQTLKGTKTFTTARLYQGGQSLNLLLDLKDATYVITKQGNALQIALNQAEKKLPEVVNAPQDSVYGMQTGYSSSLPNGVSYDSPYKGKPITLSFKDADIRTVMQVFADFTDLNLVLSDGVTGKATVHLKEIPWDQALDIVMRSKNLVARYSGKVLLISTAQDAAAQADRSSVGQFRDELDPLVVRSFDISYQSTDALGKLLLDPTKNLISSRGSVITDERTSQLIVEDTAARVQKVAKLIEQLDKAAPQVMIEARVILADKNTSRELEASIRAGARALPGQTDSTLIGSIPVDFGNREFIDSTRGADTNAAYTIFNKSGSRFLNIRLRALEQSSKIKTVSNPKVVTTNKQAALIEQGTEIPYQVATSSGATSTEFREANLKLEVTPQITPDGSIMLDVDVSKDSVGQQTAQGLAINTRHVKTRVSVADGGTVVLGGILEKSDTKSSDKVPFLGDIPILGYLFKGTSDSAEEAELLIFITPVIVQGS